MENYRQPITPKLTKSSLVSNRLTMTFSPLIIVITISYILITYLTFSATPPPSHPLIIMPFPNVKDREELDGIIANNKHVLVYCYAKEFGPCKQVTPKVEHLVELGEYPNITIIGVNVETTPGFDDLAYVETEGKMATIPRTLIYELGEQVEKFTGIVEFGQAVEIIDDIQTQINQLGSALEIHPPALDQGFKVLNYTIDYQQFDQFNVVGDARQLFKVDGTAKGVWLDADSQLMLYLPLKNFDKIHSVFIKARPNVVIDEDDGEQAQQPSTIKLWVNLPLPLLFDDAEADKNPTDVHLIKFDGDWAEIKLKYVRFQKVLLLCLFIDGDDEDTMTLVDQIVIVGMPGDPLQAAVVEKSI